MTSGEKLKKKSELLSRRLSATKQDDRAGFIPSIFLMRPFQMLNFHTHWSTKMS